MTLFAGALAFAQPAILWALLALPVIWWLLRMTPPRPLRLVFPPVRLMLGLDARTQTPATSPWWLTALRVLIAALVILALAAPVLRPDEHALSAPAGPLVVFVDNGWAAAQDWEERVATLGRTVSMARDEGRPVLLVPTVIAVPGGLSPPQEAGRVAERIGGLQPLPFAPQRMAAYERTRAALGAGARPHIVWLSDGIDHSEGADFARALTGLAGTAPVEVYLPDGARSPLVLGAPLHEGSGLAAAVHRAEAGAALSGRLRALAFNGRYLGEAGFVLPAGATETQARIELPLELRNEIARVELAGIRSAAAVRLLDESWKLPRIGLVTGESQDIAQPLLSPLYYVERALAPFAELQRDAGRNLAETVAGHIDAGVGTIVMTDVGRISGDSGERLADWVERGGMLVRFAGPRLAGGADELVPVRLRAGDRTLGGTLTWGTPQPLGPFAAAGPFAGLAAPVEVTVERQVLAEPDAGLTERTWAQLADGTPLVTGARRGKGWIVLFHVTANAAWSNLPLSGLFVEMLRRVAEMAPASLAQGSTGAGTAGAGGGAERADLALEPYRSLDGRGALTPPPATALPIGLAALAATVASSDHPPGYYGPAEAPRALNTLAGDARPVPLPALPAGALVRSYAEAEPVPLKPWLLLAALGLLAADGLAMLLLAGGAPRLRRAATAALGAFALLSAGLVEARAQSAVADDFALRATLETRLAHVVTGNGEIDATARQGLAGLSRALAQRTALEPGEPMGVDVARDELAFFPLIYWPIDPLAATPDAATLARIDAYMKQGGTILFDTRDQATAATGPGATPDGPGMRALRRLLANIDIPALEPVPADHVLGKAFYLLHAFPGRWDGGALWVEATPPDDGGEMRPVRRSDGVSSILITSNDFAAAWAVDDGNRPLYPVVPGGEPQREMALRTGINIVMYALTGNYKADQVHVPALLERLGQ